MTIKVCRFLPPGLFSLHPTIRLSLKLLYIPFFKLLKLILLTFTTSLTAFTLHLSNHAK